MADRSELRDHAPSEDDPSSDEDFNPNEAPTAGDDNISSDGESDDGVPQDVEHRRQQKSEPATKKRKRKVTFNDAELDSGDEATIQEQQAQRERRKGDNDSSRQDDEEAGEGGLIRTRAQRAAEVREKRTLATTVGSKIDVEALWAQLNAAPVGRPPSPPPPPKSETEQNKADKAEKDEEYITIKRTTEFAGQVTTEEKCVPKSSAEAKLWLRAQATSKNADKSEADTSGDSTEGQRAQLLRPLKRPSRFEPNPTGEVKALPPELQLRWPRSAAALTSTMTSATAASLNHRALPKLSEAQKLNTVQKSQYDWVQFVDKEGIAEELDEHGRAKDNYLTRNDFLKDVEARREHEARELRLAGKA
ncbi:hypothetical protein LTS18_006192 [Coniosporium uncinatum]|uniref:Uncharacterized protein n=1 Tax=Coniosporium uncinatum TaxID=93489 RepID=A0ACC3DDE0_9PEZI|nr:hypothetical protein LTS18_006192 [Coniosporium uncinatum]